MHYGTFTRFLQGRNVYVVFFTYFIGCLIYSDFSDGDAFLDSCIFVLLRIKDHMVKPKVQLT